MRLRLAGTLIVCACVVAAAASSTNRLPTTWLTAAPAITLPERVDSGVPMLWTRIGGQLTLVAFASWGGAPVRMIGSDLEHLRSAGDVVLSPHPGNGIWFESVIADEVDGTWYGYYHHELPADVCGRPDRSIPRIGAARSTDRGATWENLGIILEAPSGTEVCASTNRFVYGGVGDVSAMVDGERKDVYLYYSSYSRDPQTQGVAVARLAWANRDQPRGRVAIWQNGVWLSPVRRASAAPGVSDEWEYPSGSPILSVTKPWHDGVTTADAFWGPSIHWNTSLQQYVMLLNRTRDESFNNEGIYLSVAPTLDDPLGWSVPTRIFHQGGWYPQVAGLEPGVGTDKQMGRSGRFLITGRSTYSIDFGVRQR